MFSFDLRLNERLCNQSRGWWFETLPCPLWRHRNGKQSSIRQHAQSVTYWWNPIRKRYGYQHQCFTLQAVYMKFTVIDVDQLIDDCPRDALLIYHGTLVVGKAEKRICGHLEHWEWITRTHDAIIRLISDNSETYQGFNLTFQSIKKALRPGLLRKIVVGVLETVVISDSLLIISNTKFILSIVSTKSSIHSFIRIIDSKTIWAKHAYTWNEMQIKTISIVLTYFNSLASGKCSCNLNC